MPTSALANRLLVGIHATTGRTPTERNQNMAKQTLKNGTRKIAECHIDTARDTTSPGYDMVRTHLILRSDNKVLVAYSSPNAADQYNRRRSGYTVKGALKADRVASVGQVEAFHLFAASYARRSGSTLVIHS